MCGPPQPPACASSHAPRACLQGPACEKDQPIATSHLESAPSCSCSLSSSACRDPGGTLFLERYLEIHHCPSRREFHSQRTARDAACPDGEASKKLFQDLSSFRFAAPECSRVSLQESMQRTWALSSGRCRNSRNLSACTPFEGLFLLWHICSPCHWHTACM